MENLPTIEEINRRREAPQKMAPTKNIKYCPFSFSHPSGPIPCSDSCALRRQAKSLYCCPLAELAAISFSLRPKEN